MGNTDNNNDKNPEGIRRTVIKATFWLAVAASAFFIYVAVFKLDSIIPLYVIVFSLIGGLMYLFASTASEWAEAKKALQELKGDERLKGFKDFAKKFL